MPAPESYRSILTKIRVGLTFAEAARKAHQAEKPDCAAAAGSDARLMLDAAVKACTITTDTERPTVQLEISRLRAALRELARLGVDLNRKR